MKNAILFLVIMILCIPAVAGPFSKNMYSEQSRHRADQLRNSIINRCVANIPKAKGTQLAERLVANSNYLGTWAIDSNRYVYSGLRGSKFNFNVMAYDTDYVELGSLPIILYSSPGWYGGPNGSPDVQADSIEYWSSDLWTPTPNSPLIKSLYFMKDYDAAGNVTSFTVRAADTTAFVSSQRFLNSFDNQDNITTSVYLDFHNNQWDSTEIRNFSYDSTGHLISDSIVTLPWHSPLAKNLYQYDAAGRLVKAYTFNYVSNIWKPDHSYTLTYNATNQLVGFIDSLYFDFGWLPEQNDSMGYDGVDPFYVYYLGRRYYQGALDYYTISTKHVNGSIVDTVYDMKYDASGDWMERSFTKISYDLYGQPVTALQYSFNNFTQHYADTPFYARYYYYESYTLDADALTASRAEVKLYPNPAAGSFTIACTGPTDKGTKAELYDMCGRLVTVIPIITSHTYVNTSTLPRGLYVCKVIMNGESFIQKLAIQP